MDLRNTINILQDEITYLHRALEEKNTNDAAKSCSDINCENSHSVCGGVEVVVMVVVVVATVVAVGDEVVVMVVVVNEWS